MPRSFCARARPTGFQEKNRRRGSGTCFGAPGFLSRDRLNWYASDPHSGWKCIIHVVVEPGADRRHGSSAFGVRRLVKDFQAYLQVGGNLPRDDQSGLAEVL